MLRSCVFLSIHAVFATKNPRARSPTSSVERSTALIATHHHVVFAAAVYRPSVDSKETICENALRRLEIAAVCDHCLGFGDIIEAVGRRTSHSSTAHQKPCHGEEPRPGIGQFHGVGCHLPPLSVGRSVRGHRSSSTDRWEEVGVAGTKRHAARQAARNSGGKKSTPRKIPKKAAASRGTPD